MKKRNWKKYTFEFLSIFIAVVSAFALNNWNEIRRNNQAESKILVEILNGLEKDFEDVKLNVQGHEQSIMACKFWKRVLADSTTNTDTLVQYYFVLTRDFVSIQNTSGYETLKSRGLELIKNDSLRTQIIALYEYDYKTLAKLEEEYSELQFHDNYFKELNALIAPNLVFNEQGNISGINLPLNINKQQVNIFLSYLWQIQFNRKFVLSFYDTVKRKMQDLKTNIEQEINQ